LDKDHENAKLRKHERRASGERHRQRYADLIPCFFVLSFFRHFVIDLPKISAVPFLRPVYQFYNASIGLQRPPHPIEQLPRSVPVAPGVYVVPVDPIALHGDDVPGVVHVFAAPPGVGPTKLRDNDVLGGRDRHVAIENPSAAAAGKTRLVVLIIAQEEQLDMNMLSVCRNMQRLGADTVSNDICRSS